MDGRSLLFDIGSTVYGVYSAWNRLIDSSIDETCIVTAFSFRLQ